MHGWTSLASSLARQESTRSCCERSPRPHVRTVRRSDDPFRDESRQPEASEGIENEGRVARIEGLWWQFSLTERGPREPSAVSLLRISRDREGALEVGGRSWQEDGTLSARYWSEARGHEHPGRPRRAATREVDR